MDSKTGVFFIDDNSLDIMIGERLLSLIYPEVLTKSFLSSKEFISWLDNSGPDLSVQQVILFIDINMPEIRGFELATIAHNHFESSKIKLEIYLLSASIDQQDLDKIEKSAIIKGFVGKPLTQQAIQSVVRK